VISSSETNGCERSVEHQEGQGAVCTVCAPGLLMTAARCQSRLIPRRLRPMRSLHFLCFFWSVSACCRAVVCHHALPHRKRCCTALAQRGNDGNESRRQRRRRIPSGSHSVEARDVARARDRGSTGNGRGKASAGGAPPTSTPATGRDARPSRLRNGLACGRARGFQLH
jgi:hypothetical protein